MEHSTIRSPVTGDLFVGFVCPHCKCVFIKPLEEIKDLYNGRPNGPKQS